MLRDIAGVRKFETLQAVNGKMLSVGADAEAEFGAPSTSSA
ncbi:hypothetical protein GL4_0486 [Methyloceanibacter caenitepidi]|uniref:Uncharacterized protein n=1 Tax=Methyloceanibacter caenitepidi TaxID=1384459 RepID=A0A0A8K0C7_9HYPH|nr:hypothetical protein GL4_0486 [Methyloceanibacter caenitepidi]